MTEQRQTTDAREAEDRGTGDRGAEDRGAEDRGEKPDLGRMPDALTDALSGSGMGSDTRAGSLKGGAATGSDIDPDQATIDAALARTGRQDAADAETG